MVIQNLVVFVQNIVKSEQAVSARNVTCAYLFSCWGYQAVGRIGNIDERAFNFALFLYSVIIVNPFL